LSKDVVALAMLVSIRFHVPGLLRPVNLRVLHEIDHRFFEPPDCQFLDAR
jgi:hypothetical protein